METSATRTQPSPARGPSPCPSVAPTHRPGPSAELTPETLSRNETTSLSVEKQREVTPLAVQLEFSSFWWFSPAPTPPPPAMAEPSVCPSALPGRLGDMALGPPVRGSAPCIRDPGRADLPRAASLRAQAPASSPAWATEQTLLGWRRAAGAPWSCRFPSNTVPSAERARCCGASPGALGGRLQKARRARGPNTRRPCSPCSTQSDSGAPVGVAVAGGREALKTVHAFSACTAAAPLRQGLRSPEVDTRVRIPPGAPGGPPSTCRCTCTDGFSSRHLGGSARGCAQFPLARWEPRPQGPVSPACADLDVRRTRALASRRWSACPRPASSAGDEDQRARRECP